MKTPLIDSIIAIASVITRRELAKEGRSLESLGFAGMSHDEVLAFVNG